MLDTLSVCYNEAVAEVGLPTARHHEWSVMRVESNRTEKACFKCGLVKPMTEFYRHPMMGDGHLGKCKTCAKLDVAQNRRKRLDYYLGYDQKRYRENAARRQAILQSSARRRRERRKYDVHWMVSNALRSGRLTKPDRCEDCGRKADRIEGHHEDYSKPLEVVWLCPLCHGKRHRTVVLPPHMEVEEPPITGRLFNGGDE